MREHRLKRILAILAALTVVTSASASTVACGTPSISKPAIQKDLSKINLNGPIVIGTNLETLLNQIFGQFGENKLEEGTDYKIIDQTKGLTEKGELKIVALKTSKVLIGELTINVEPVSIDNVVLFSKAMPWHQITNINQEIITKINTLFAKTSKIKISEADFEILNAENEVINWNKNPEAGNFTVQAKSTSKLITGKFNFSLGTINISTLQVPNIEVGDNFQSKIDEVLNKIKDLDEDLNIVEGVDYEIIDSTNQATQKGMIEINGLPTSKLITGKLTVNVNPKSINKIILTNEPIDLAKLANLNETIITKVNDLFTNNSKLMINETDYEILNEQGQKIDLVSEPKIGTYLVQASSTSKLITGSFSFTITNKAEFKNLKVAIDEANKVLNEADKSIDQSVLKAAINEATNILNNPSALQKTIDETINNLKAIEANFKTTELKKAQEDLQKTVDETTTILKDDTKYDDGRRLLWDALQKAEQVKQSNNLNSIKAAEKELIEKEKLFNYRINSNTWSIGGVGAADPIRDAAGITNATFSKARIMFDHNGINKSFLTNDAIMHSTHYFKNGYFALEINNDQNKIVYYQYLNADEKMSKIINDQNFMNLVMKENWTIKFLFVNKGESSHSNFLNAQGNPQNLEDLQTAPKFNTWTIQDNKNGKEFGFGRTFKFNNGSFKIVDKNGNTYN